MQARNLLSLLALTLAASPLAAAPAPRILPHDYQVQNFVPRGTDTATRLGRLNASDTLDVAIGLPLRNRKALALLHTQLHDPNHPLYHQWLSSSEFTEAYGPTAEDYGKLVAWAQSKGLEIVNQAPNRLILNVRGPAPAIEQAFGVQMNHYQTPDGKTFHSSDRAPSLDVDVAIASINGLNNLTKPVSRLQHKAELSGTPHTGSGTGGLYIGKDFRAAYAAGVPSTTNGAGQGIALFEFSEYYPVDVSNYFTTAGITEPSITVVTAGTSPGSYSGEDEVALDIDIAGSLAPGANIYVYEGSDGTTILNQIITDGKCKSVGVSWGWASDNMTTQTSIDSTQDAVFEAMDAAGIACFVAAGDSATWTTSQWAQSVTSSSFNPINPADEPYVTCVGGSELSTATAGGAWSGEVVWPDCGSGYSHRYAMPSYQSSGINWSSVAGASTTMRNCCDVTSCGYDIYLDYDNGKEIAQNVGGTSCAAPLWAAFAALANQTAVAAGKSTMGYINPIIYGIGTSSSYATCLHDITSGTDGIAAGVGIDMPSGWGSPVGLTTINALIGATTPTIAVTVSPTTAALTTGGTQQFTATVTGTTTTTVTWTCSGGTVSATGLYTAPATAGTYTVTATSTANTAISAKATVTVTSGTPTVTVAISPTSATLVTGGTQQFTDTVTGTSNTAVNWTATGGTITSAGLYTAPATAGNYTVTCTSQASASATATAAVTVTAGGAQQLILNPYFASGSTDWTATSQVIGAWGTSEPAYTGTECAWLDGYSSAHTDYLYQTVAIPSTITSATLNVWLHINTTETNGTADDTLKLEVRNSSGTVLATLATFSNLNAASGYAEHSYNLAAYKGETVQIYFTAAQTGRKATSFVVGQVNLNVQ
jgi:xanthomonalisin